MESIEKEVREIIDEKVLRKQQAEKVVNFLTKIDAYDYVQRLRSDGRTGEKPSFEEFRDFLVRLNGIVRDIPIHERSTDGTSVYISGFVGDALLPAHADKEGILKDAYDSLDNISVGDEAYLLPAVINAVHLFADGNGRTSRMIHTLLKSATEDEFRTNLQIAAGNEGRFETANVNPGTISTDLEKIVLMRHGINFLDDGDYSPVFPEGFGHLFASIEETTRPKAKEFMSFRQIDQPYCFISAYEYLKEKDLLGNVLIQIPSGLALSPHKMEQELTDADWDEMIHRYYGLKKEHVEVLIAAFVDPDAYKNLDGSMNLRDFFIQKIQRELQENRLPF